MQAVGQNPDIIHDKLATEDFANEEPYRKDGNLYFDQSIFKGKRKNKINNRQSTVQKLKSKLKRQDRTDSIASESSDDSDLSDDAFLN